MTAVLCLIADLLIADVRIPTNTYCYTAANDKYHSNITMDNCNKWDGKLVKNADFSIGECKVFERSIWYGNKVWDKTSAEKDCKSKGGEFIASKN